MVMSTLSILAFMALFYVECNPKVDTDGWLKKILLFSLMIFLVAKG